MNIDLGAGGTTYAYTGGKAFDAGKPTVLMIHGVLNDHSVWNLQSRWLANHGWNVLAIDLPGHGRSTGEPPASVEEAADGVARLLDAARVDKAAIVGHSFGALIAIEAAARLKGRATHLVPIGVAHPMTVSPALLAASKDDPQAAIRTINVYSRSTLAAPPSSLGPGTWVWGSSMALNRRVLASNPRVNLFHRGFSACDAWRGGEAAMRAGTCPVQFILGEQDQMTPPAGAKGLVAAGREVGRRVEVAALPVGHHQMTEAPEATLAVLGRFLAA